MKRILCLYIIGCPHGVIPMSRACTCLRGNNSNDCVQRSPASPNPCISDTLSPLSSLCRSILYISPRAQAPHTNTNNNGYTHVPPVPTHWTSPCHETSRIKSWGILFSISSLEDVEDWGCSEGQWLAVAPRILHAISPRGFYFDSRGITPIFSYDGQRGWKCVHGELKCSPPPSICIKCHE